MNPSASLVMQYMPGTLVDLRKRTGLARSTVIRTIIKLHGADPKQCYILKYVESAVGKNGPLLAVYQLGDLPDAVCPVAPRAGQPTTDNRGMARARAVADAERVSKVRDPWIWWCFDVNVEFK